ncbi:hypothetical protein BU17DRAFT_57126 [Hysterangium stoloniferum]|nr:hypothetical protein BU17DRAFT_57126 [Hysterangium stoloniferum]
MPSDSTSKLEEPFAALSLSENIGAGLPSSQSTRRPSRTLSGSKDKVASQPSAHLISLLRECGQTSPYSFNAFVETFPSDNIHESHALEPLTFRKIGEASFSEVFAIGNIVLKVIPLRDESASTRPFDGDVDLPQESESKDVLQEMIVTRTLGQACRGFVKLLKTYIVVGEYPSLLLSLWDEFNDKKLSENIRPDVFPSSQAYALMVLPNGGSDLETYTFPPKVGWQQACSVFWQTAKALALAEDLVSFEHRDLHWGQILIKAVGSTRKAPRTSQRGRRRSNSGDIAMDHPSHGVVTTIIDLGLARMDAVDPSGISVHWTPLDELIFQGEGDYQFDVYRMMKQVHGNRWDKYRPLTNVMWLHYLSLKLIRAKRLRAPNLRGVTAVSNEFGEKSCYECLVEMEALLGSSIRDKTKRGGAIKGFFQNARDVVNFAQERGWLHR